MRRSSTLGRHPLHVGLACLVAGLLLAEAPQWLIALGGTSGAMTALVGGRPRLAVGAAALVVLGAWGGEQRLAAIDRSPLRPYVGRSVAVRGHVVKRERPLYGSYRVRIGVTAVALGLGPGADREVSDTVELRTARRPPIELSLGDEVEARGVLELPRRSRRSDFDYPAYLNRAGVHALMRAERLEPTGRRRGGLHGLVDTVRLRAERGLRGGLEPRLQALARGIVLGQDEQIDEHTVERFQLSGLAHLLAVSGQNVTLLAILTLAVLRALGAGRRTRYLGVLALIALYVPLTGAGPSILRAGAMGSAATVAALAGRPASRWYALLLASAFTLALDPRAWLDPGWQLSFAAVAGIFVGAPALRRALGRFPRPLAEGIAVTVAATLATAPLLAYHFERLSIVSLAANLLAMPAIAPIMWLGTLAGAVGQVSPLAAALLGAPNGFLLAYLSAVADWSGGLPHASIPIRLDSAAALLATYAGGAAVAGGAVAAARWRRQQDDRKGPAVAAAAVTGAATLVLVAVLILAGRSEPGERPGRFTVTFLDVGQGDAILLQSPGGADVLVDGGPASEGIVGKLRKAGAVSLDLVVLTHPQADHQGGLEEVVRKIPVATLLDGGAVEGAPSSDVHERIVALARARGARVMAPREGDSLRWGRFALHVLGPRREDLPAEEPNDAAIVLLASYRGLDVFLPADAESNATLGLPLRPVEVLKVAHHGSADEELGMLLERLRPGVAVIEVGEDNRYGHPSPPTVAALRATVPNLLRTDQDGDVRVSLEPGGLAVERGK